MSVRYILKERKKIRNFPLLFSVRDLLSAIICYDIVVCINLYRIVKKIKVRDAGQIKQTMPTYKYVHTLRCT